MRSRNHDASVIDRPRSNPEILLQTLRFSTAPLSIIISFTWCRAGYFNAGGHGRLYQTAELYTLQSTPSCAPNKAPNTEIELYLALRISAESGAQPTRATSPFHHLSVFACERSMLTLLRGGYSYKVAGKERNIIFSGVRAFRTLCSGKFASACS